MFCSCTVDLGSSSSTLASPSARSHHPYDQVTSPTLHITLGGPSVLGTGQHATYSTNTNPSAAAAECTSVSGTLSKRPPNHSLKSFSVPAPPCQSAPTTPQPRHIGKTKKLLTYFNKKKFFLVCYRWLGQARKSYPTQAYF